MSTENSNIKQPCIIHSVVRCASCNYCFNVIFVNVYKKLEVEKWVMCPDCGTEFLAVNIDLI